MTSCFYFQAEEKQAYEVGGLYFVLSSAPAVSFEKPIWDLEKTTFSTETVCLGAFTVLFKIFIDREK